MPFDISSTSCVWACASGKTGAEGKSTQHRQSTLEIKFCVDVILRQQHLLRDADRHTHTRSIDKAHVVRLSTTSKHSVMA
jgi:hypothetical protein